jgi:hypothetical protein
MTVPSASGKCTALLVIDLQLGMFNGERIAPIHAGEMLLARVRTLLLQARQSGTLTGRDMSSNTGRQTGKSIRRSRQIRARQSSISPRRTRFTKRR